MDIIFSLEESWDEGGDSNLQKTRSEKRKSLRKRFKEGRK